MEPNDHKFCPFCHLINPVDAIFCQHCGQPFASAPGAYPTNSKVEQATKFFPSGLEEKIEPESREAPAEGIALYVTDQTGPIEIRLDQEFVVGRLTEEAGEQVVDLTPYNACDSGVSRRHLMIRRDGAVYNVIDLNSTNGTWVNGQALPPQKPFPIKSGSQIRMGKMRILIAFQQ